jgi:uncharacterized membrane protein
MHTLKTFILSFILIIAIDAVWLNIIAKPWYWQAYEDWFRVANGKLDVIYWSAILVYILLALGITLLAIPMAHNNNLHALLYGGLLGAVTYGVYDFTCLAIFAEWPLQISFIDWAWGTVLCGVTSLLTILLLPSPKGY